MSRCLTIIRNQAVDHLFALSLPGIRGRLWPSVALAFNQTCRTGAVSAPIVVCRRKYTFSSIECARNAQLPEFGPIRPAANDFVRLAQMLQCLAVFGILEALAACHVFPLILDDLREVGSIAVIYR
jgi:hypothetical protein